MQLIPYLTFIFCLGIAGTALAGEQQPQTVDLNVPGALEALARDNPPHYKKVREIMSEVQRQPEDQELRWMYVRFNARNVVYEPVLLVTDPPKRQLSFTLDEIRYYSAITLVSWKAKILPAK